MTDKLFVTVWGLQEKEIKHFCFDQCKKVIFGLLMDDTFGGLSHCYEVKCPFLDKEMTEPFGEVSGHPAYLRKLVDVPAAKEG